MILSKLFLVSAAVLPLFTPKGRTRGCPAYEALLPIGMPVETSGPLPEQASEDSPRLSLPPAPHLRLVHDATTGQNASSDPSDAFEIRSARVIEFDKRKAASTRKFVKWLREFHGGEDLSRTGLLARYFEYTELENVRPVKERQLLNCIKEYGVETSRPTAKLVGDKLTRPTLYHVRPVIRRVA